LLKSGASLRRLFAYAQQAAPLLRGKYQRHLHRSPVNCYTLERPQFAAENRHARLANARTEGGQHL